MKQLIADGAVAAEGKGRGMRYAVVSLSWSKGDPTPRHV
jgi:hypothetical protein